MGKETKSVVIAGVFSLLAVLGTLWYVNEQSKKVDERTAAIAELQTQIDALQKEASERDALQEELANLRANLSQYVKILPSPEVATEERLLELVHEKCERSQFELKRYTQKAEPKRKAPPKKGRGKKSAKDSSPGGFKEIGLVLQAEGTYEQFLRFLNSLERHESFLRVNSFTCQAAAPTGRADGPPTEQALQLAITLDVSTFRYDAGGK